MLASGFDVSVNTGVEGTVCSWTSDGARHVIGYNASCDIPAIVRLYVNGTKKYESRTSSEYPTAYLADKDFIVTSGQIVELKVIQITGFAQNISGQILGG